MWIYNSNSLVVKRLNFFVALIMDKPNKNNFKQYM